MLHDYADIRSRISEPPKWWDEHGVPRWSDFGPREVANIYCHEAVLAEVTCQGCGQAFQVAFSRDDVDLGIKGQSLEDEIRAKDLHYGDPPNIGCCPAGPTMNSEPRRVIEFWTKPSPLAVWVRDAALEVDIRPDWVTEGDAERA